MYRWKNRAPATGRGNGGGNRDVDKDKNEGEDGKGTGAGTGTRTEGRKRPGNLQSDSRGVTEDARKGVTPKSNQQAQPHDPTPQQEGHITQKTRAEEREAKDRTEAIDPTLGGLIRVCSCPSIPTSA